MTPSSDPTATYGPLLQVLYYRTEADAHEMLNWDGMHDVAQGVELAFDSEHLFITWDTAAEKGIAVQQGRMVDFLRRGLFENVSDHADWLPLIGQPLERIDYDYGEVILIFDNDQHVSIVTAEVDRQSLHADYMADNLTVFLSQDRRDSFFTQYPATTDDEEGGSE